MAQKKIYWARSASDLANTFFPLGNSQVNTIQFTLEVENDNKLPFLDVLVTKSDKVWHTSVYKKPMATGQYLHYNSYHPDHVKLGLAIGLIKRARKICSDEKTFKEELGRIETNLKDSGYPQYVLKKAMDKAINVRTDIQVEAEPAVDTVCIPYIRNLSEKIRRINKKHNIRTVFKSTRTIRSQLTKVKPNNLDQQNKNVVYKVPCSCDRNYIGQTSRPVKTRIEEHMKKVKNKESYGSKISEHVLETGHNIKWTDSCVLYKEQNWKKRNFAESLFMAHEKQPLSRPSKEINPVYMEVVKKELQELNIKGNNRTIDLTHKKVIKPGDNAVHIRRSDRIRDRQK